MHPAEHRGYRELTAFTRALVVHWPALADRLGPGDAADILRSGAEQAGTLLAELREQTAERDLYGGPAAQGVGRFLAGARNAAGDRFLERNQALRFAAQEVQHLGVLLGYLAAVAEQRGDEELSAFAGRWERKLRRTESAVRAAAIELGSTPDAAVAPLSAGVGGRAAHGVQQLVGSFGEWFDRRAARGVR